MANPWFKFYANDYLSEIKLKGVCATKRSCFLTALCYASQSDGCIDTRYMTNDQLKIESGVSIGGSDWDDVGDVYEWMTYREFGKMEGNLFIFKNWDTRQTMSAYDRVKKHRQKMKDDNADDNKLITTEQNRTDKNRTELFDKVWEVYPKKVGKKDAFKAFEKLKPNEQITENIISTIESLKQTPQWQDNDGRYIPHPATFLNRESFDEASAVKKAPKIIEWQRTDAGMKPIYEPSTFAKSLNKRA